MLSKKWSYSTLLLILLLCSTAVSAQKERSMARKGNRFYADSAYTEAEVAYLKALDLNPEFKEAQFNLGNNAIRQQKFEEAIEQFEVLAADAEDKDKASDIYHNIGNAYLGKYQLALQDQQQAQKAGEDLDKSIEAFKQSLRYRPSDDETRYNLAVAQKLKEQGPPPQDQQQQQQDQQQQQQDQQQQQEQNQEQQEQEQNQDQQQQDQQQQQQQQQPQPNQISKEDAEKILNAMMQEEKELQEEQKEKQKAKARSMRVEKDW